MIYSFESHFWLSHMRALTHPTSHAPTHPVGWGVVYGPLKKQAIATILNVHITPSILILFQFTIIELKKFITIPIIKFAELNNDKNESK